MESLMSGVEPFILCAEFLNVRISKIAVMAALTVNLWCSCNLIPSCLVDLFCVLAGRPALCYWLLVTTRSGRKGTTAQGSLLFHASAWEICFALYWSLVLCRAEPCLAAWGPERVGTERVRHFFPKNIAPNDKDSWIRWEETAIFLCLVQLELLPHLVGDVTVASVSGLFHVNMATEERAQAAEAKRVGSRLSQDLCFLLNSSILL